MIVYDEDGLWREGLTPEEEDAQYDIWSDARDVTFQMCVSECFRELRRLLKIEEGPSHDYNDLSKYVFHATGEDFVEALNAGMKVASARLIECGAYPVTRENLWPVFLDALSVSHWRINETPEITTRVRLGGLAMIAVFRAGQMEPELQLIDDCDETFSRRNVADSVQLDDLSEGPATK